MTKTYNGTWIIFTARDGELFRDFVARRNDLAAAIVNAASKVEAKGFSIPRDAHMSLLDASIPVSPYRKKSRKHFTSHAREAGGKRKVGKRKSAKPR